MNSKLWIRKALTTCLMTAIVATYSMVALATTGRAAGELMITGTTNEASAVTVNGEPASSGRTIFSSSTISTPEGVTATVNFGKAGTISFGPNSTFTVNFDGKAIGGDLTAGSITVLSATNSVGVKTLSGTVVQLKAGETATAGAVSAKKADDDDDDDTGGPDWWVFALIFGGAAVGVIWAASANNDAHLGSGAITVSPIR